VPTFLKFVSKIQGLQLTRLYLGLTVIQPSGLSSEEGLLFPYCWSINTEEINENRSFVVTVGAGSSTDLQNPFP